VLEIRPNCECCDRDLAPDALNVWICSFECTWCAECRERFAEHRCPNCNGVLTLRTREPELPSPLRRPLGVECSIQTAWRSADRSGTVVDAAL